MKRAFVILVALTVFMLILPSADLFAKSPKPKDSKPYIITPRDHSPPGSLLGNDDGDDDDGDGSGDKGDADDLAGKRFDYLGMGSSMIPGSSLRDTTAAKIMWMYFLMVKLF